jgi:hypothetical protein
MSLITCLARSLGVRPPFLANGGAIVKYTLLILKGMIRADSRSPRQLNNKKYVRRLFSLCPYK